MTNTPITFVSAFESSIQNNTFVKITLANYKGTEQDLKRIRIQKTLIKREEKYSFVYSYQTKDITKNYDLKEALTQVNELHQFEQFRLAQLFTTSQDISSEYVSPGKNNIRKKPATHQTLPGLEHDHQKKRAIAAADNHYLHALEITDAFGNVYKNAQDKYKQINHFIEILKPLLSELPAKEKLDMVDMGSGKGYLTFALYDYLNNHLKKPTAIKGIEVRKELVDLCNKIAKESKFKELHFIEGDIHEAQIETTDLLMALHACDTATDEAIAKGIKANAQLIIVAPCCHKQIRKSMEKHQKSNELDFLTQYGIFLERQAEMVTDGIRALILEYYGYTTKVIQFVSDMHTPKNVMITGIKSKKEVNQAEILAKIQAAKSYFGIDSHFLETLLPELMK